MSQNRHKKFEFNSIRSLSFERVFYSILIICLAGILILGAGSAQAAVTGTKIGRSPTYVLKTNLDTMASKDSAILDWRTQEFELAFDLPANDWYESLDLFLSAYPEGQVAQGTPLLISYNGAKPVPLYGRGSRFDAHIRLDTSRIRLSGNSIKISYQTPRNADCLKPAHGQWVLDLSKSKLVANARTKKRAMQISEIEQRLTHAMTAPNRVRILAKGENRLAFEALTAQAVAQRMSYVPEFKLGSGPADMQFVIGTHDDIRPLIKNPDILKSQGANVAIDNGRTPKIVLTAETEEQVMELVRAFASYKLPAVKRGKVLLHEFYAGTKLEPHTIIDTKNYKLSDIGTPVLNPSWRPDPAQIDFNVTDPHASSGILTLKILSAKDINPKSRLSVKLNNKSIGYTQLNKSSKMVEFRIKPGMFTASSNRISMEADIQPDRSAALCDSQGYIPTVLVSNRSKFRLTTSKPSPATELSRLAASGAPFDRNSTVVLTAKTLKDKHATLRLLGYAAQQFGPSWAQADYVSTLPEGGDHDKNVLIIGPNPMLDAKLVTAAPSALRQALGKKSGTYPTSQTVAGIDRFASADKNQTFKMAARNNSASRLQSGGLAALFPSPYANGRMIGVISADNPANYARALQDVVTRNYWNGLQGSVTRWDKSVVLMAQTATPLPVGFGLPETERITNTPKFVTTAKNWLASLSVNKPADSKPVQTASNSQKIPVIRVTEPTQLRGSFPAKPAPQKPVTTKKQGKFSWPKISKPAMPKFNKPSMTSLKLKGFQVKRDLQSWWTKASRNAFEATPLRQWWKDLLQNRAAFFGLIVFLAFFITALASPVSIRRKK